MRAIPIDDLQETFDELNGPGSFEVWFRKAEEHLSQIRDMDKKSRGKYWAKNNFWKELYPALSKISGHKCWYSESPENSSEWEIDHYRPKAKSINEDGVTIRDNGYWWLSYHWKNFRLSGSLVNKLRRDRFTDDDEVLGKGNFFPLENENSTGQPEDMYCDCERPLLIDPINPRDVTLISFDKNGEPYPTYNEVDDSLNNKKAKLSIKYYGLKHTPLDRARSKIWSNCETVVSKAHNYIKNKIDDPNRRNTQIDNCYIQLAKYSRKNEPFSMVVRNFVKEKLKDNNYSWLADVGLVLGN